MEKPLDKKSEKKNRDYATVILEEMRGDIKLIAEGQVGIQRQLDEFKGEMLGFKDEMYEFKGEMLGFKDEMYEFKGEMLGFKNEMLGFKNEMFGFKRETKNNFKAVLEYLSRMEDELMEIKNDLKNNYEKKSKDKEWRAGIEKRLGRLEKILTNKKPVSASA